MATFAFPFATPFGGIAPALPDPRPAPSYAPNFGTTDLGTDIGCLNDLDPTFALVSGNTCVAQRLARLLATPTNGLEYAPSRGRDLRDYVNAGFTESQVYKVRTDVQAELQQDEAVKSASAKVTFNPASGVMTIDTTVLTAAGPLPLVVNVTALDLTLTRTA